VAFASSVGLWLVTLALAVQGWLRLDSVLLLRALLTLVVLNSRRFLAYDAPPSP